MLWEKASSTNISKVGYDQATGVLHVKFRSGVTYCYNLVPEDVYEDFKACGFSGKFLNTRIKGHYTFDRL